MNKHDGYGGYPGGPAAHARAQLGGYQARLDLLISEGAPERVIAHARAQRDAAAAAVARQEEAKRG